MSWQHMARYIMITVLLCLLLSGCTKKVSALSTDQDTDTPKGSPRDNTPVVLVPVAEGTTVFASDTAVIDASHTAEGYVMVQYNGTVSKVKLQLESPDGATYTYLMSSGGSFETFPLSAGSGHYKITVNENVDGDLYAPVLSQEIEAVINDELKLFLYPNQYVNFSSESTAVTLGQELVSDAYTDLEAIEKIYTYVIQNITYDTALAENVDYGYLPDLEQTLTTKTGICFDYASLMAAMLRSQRIPTRLEVGYSGDAYHAWISTYVEEIGWVADVIEFDGTSWTLMDPTLAANNKAASVKKYVGDGSHYTVKYSY